MYIVKYIDELEKEWDTFVKNSVNGTIYHTRKFLNYHPKDRFTDVSILIYDKNKIVCVLPVCQNENGGYFSHSGSTFGSNDLL